MYVGHLNSDIHFAERLMADAGGFHRCIKISQMIYVVYDGYLVHVILNDLEMDDFHELPGKMTLMF